MIRHDVVSSWRRKSAPVFTPALVVVSALAFCVEFASVADAAVETISYDLGLAKPYTIVQLGNNGGDFTNIPPDTATGGDKLEITSNSSVFGSTLKGVDDKPELNKITTSKVTGAWDRETGVVNDLTSSATGSKNTLSTPTFNDIAADAVAASIFWAGEPASGITVDLNSGATQTIMASGGGANVFNSTGGFILNSASKLILTGGPGDFFVFNILNEHLFSMQSNSIIELGGDIEASEVLFNVLGNIGSVSIGDDGTLVGGGSIFQGTLLAPGRKVEVTQNHFFTFTSGGLLDEDGGMNAPSTTPITAAEAIFEKENTPDHADFGGLFGQIIAGGAINFTQSDIAHHPFMTMPIPEPASFVVWLLLGLTCAGISGRRRRQPK